MSDTGPGKTRFIPNEDGSISLKRWNDDGWVTRLADAQDLSGKLAAENVCRLLRTAYQMGLEERATLIKQAIGL